MRNLISVLVSLNCAEHYLEIHALNYKFMDTSRVIILEESL